MSKRRTSQSSHDADDSFVVGVLEVTNWARANQQLMTVGGVLLAILIAGGFYYMNFRSQMNERAAESLETIYQSISINDTEGAKIDLATFLDQFGSTAYEGEARLVLGELYLESGDPQQALAVLEPIGQRPGSPVALQSATLLAQAYEQEGRWEEAEDTYLSIADRSDLDFQVRDALVAAARIRSAQGDGEGAIELYEEVLGDLDENAPNRGQFEMRIEEIRSGSNT
ncbi:MAG: tetratricopeptide repeat protein [Gemmatimonadota bacterium]|nr:tetratricopeptide repeat protein [Gemmatimonadota bacterium]MDE3005093.1 tetratricopeptide repeat protein [Gemmatimonadota bacterium]MDE3013181.1 tetratricopeptide repeat protein [Gemmatimonadota bacterium]